MNQNQHNQTSSSSVSARNSGTFSSNGHAPADLDPTLSSYLFKAQPAPPAPPAKRPIGRPLGAKGKRNYRQAESDPDSGGEVPESSRSGKRARQVNDTRSRSSGGEEDQASTSNRSQGVKRRRVKKDDASSLPEIQFDASWSPEDEAALKDRFSVILTPQAVLDSSTIQERALYQKSLVLFDCIPPIVLGDIRVNTPKDKPFYWWNNQLCEHFNLLFCCPAFEGRPEFLRYTLRYALYLRTKGSCGRPRPDDEQITDQVDEFWDVVLPEHFGIIKQLEKTARRGWKLIDKVELVRTCDVMAINDAWDKYSRQSTGGLQKVKFYRDQFNKLNPTKGAVKAGEVDRKDEFVERKGRWILQVIRSRARSEKEQISSRSIGQDDDEEIGDVEIEEGEDPAGPILNETNVRQLGEGQEMLYMSRDEESWEGFPDEEEDITGPRQDHVDDAPLREEDHKPDHEVIYISSDDEDLDGQFEDEDLIGRGHHSMPSPELGGSFCIPEIP